MPGYLDWIRDLSDLYGEKLDPRDPNLAGNL
jgi:hypothetical protein